MKLKIKKSLLGIAGLSALIAPVAATISCGASEDYALVILNGKTQIDEEGRAFANKFSSSNDFKNVSDGANEIQFITKNGNKFASELAKTFGSKEFPAAWTAASTTVVKQYLKQKAITVFHNPKYNKEGNAIDTNAEAFNKDLVGEKVNKIIKQLQTTGRGNLLLKNSDGNILGFPAYTESMGLIYNKKLFKKAGVTIEISKDGSAMSQADWNAKIGGPTAVTTKSDFTINPKLDLTSAEKTNQLLAHIFAVLKDKNIAGTRGVVTKGTESWALTSKVFGIVGISAAAKVGGLSNEGAVIPGETYASTRLTPDTAQDKLFKNKNQPGIKGLEEATKFFLDKSNGNKKKISSYDTNVQMYEAFQAGKIITMPQGSWVETTLNKTSGLEYGFLPIPLSGATSNVATGVSSYWVISDQVNSNKRSAEKAKAYRTQAVNYIYSQYISEDGRKSLEKDMGLNNPFMKNEFLDTQKHPLLGDAGKYIDVNGEVLRWGIAFNKPGVGKDGYERNNNAWTQILDKYLQKSTQANLDAIKDKAVDIWKKK